MSEPANAVVRVTISVKNLGHWNDACTVQQVREQAAEAAVNRLRKLFMENKDFTVIGRPEVRLISVPLDGGVGE